MTIRVRKAQAGSTSGGRRWVADGEVIDLPDDEATELLAIPDGGFTAVPLPQAVPVQEVPPAAPLQVATPEPVQAISAPPVAVTKPRRRRSTAKE